jgi:hypothetical protein
MAGIPVATKSSLAVLGGSILSHLKHTAAERSLVAVKVTG